MSKPGRPVIKYLHIMETKITYRKILLTIALLELLMFPLFLIYISNDPNVKVVNNVYIIPEEDILDTILIAQCVLVITCCWFFSIIDALQSKAYKWAFTMFIVLPSFYVYLYLMIREGNANRSIKNGTPHNGVP